MPKSAQTIGILGAGRVGTAIARQALKSGYDVSIATSKPPEDISLLVEVVTPGATATTATDVATADIVILAIPLHRYKTLSASSLTGKVVVDAMNYWAPTDGEIDDFEADDRISSCVVQDHLRDARIIKTLNHIGYHDLEEEWRSPGAADRRALALAGDDTTAKSIVSTFIDTLGFDAVDAGPLTAGALFEPGTEIFNGKHTQVELEKLLRRSRSYVPSN
ncbi:NADPH-dependent F420 reductase [Rhodococcus sp. JVH1]|uniref:NADPH-dependent F420 reductase n=1 Tax=Rhodococcus sp. JVH1 TaxID=745408 RepID=UPI0002721817|nr:NADP oxidoreductase coenzyme F420-dependent family protein [Rhodococcus sp. JVH1]